MRLIDADVAHKMVKQHEGTDEMWVCTGATAISLIHNAIDRVPTVDAVPVVRCRDCKFWEPYGSKGSRNGEDPLELEGGCMKWRGRLLESDFCSYGKERAKPTNSLNQEERWLKTV